MVHKIANAKYKAVCSLPVLLVDLVVVGALADGRVEGKGLVQVAGL